MTSNTEVDLYAGFSGETGSSEYDIGVIRYSIWTRPMTTTMSSTVVLRFLASQSVVPTP